METDQKRFSKIANGIGMILAATVVLFVWFLSVLLLPVSTGFGIGAAKVVMVLFSLTVPILMTVFLLSIAGPCLCLATPREARSTGWILATVILSALGLLFSVLPFVIRIPAVLSFVGGFLPFLSQVTFILYLRKLSHYLNRDDLVKLTTNILIFAILSLLILIGSSVIGRGAALLGALGSALFGLLAFLHYLRLLQYTRAAATKKAQSTAD